MIEARVFVDEIESARDVLRHLGASDQGEYVIDDRIYRNRDESYSLTDEFLRIRSIPKNIWDEKPFIIALKQTKLRNVGKESRIPLKLQFDSIAEAEKYYAVNLKKDYLFDFAFSRIGWQYILPNKDVVDLEVLEEKYPTIEFKSTTDEGMQRLLGTFAITQDMVIKGPSVVAFKSYTETQSPA